MQKNKARGRKRGAVGIGQRGLRMGWDGMAAFCQLPKAHLMPPGLYW